MPESAPQAFEAPRRDDACDVRAVAVKSRRAQRSVNSSWRLRFLRGRVIFRVPLSINRDAAAAAIASPSYQSRPNQPLAPVTAVVSAMS